MDVILQTFDLSKAFGGLVAVDSVTIQIARGSRHSIIGPNGAGKTTLFNLLTGKHKPTRGRVLFKGQDITRLPVHRRAHIGIGRSFQITNIFPNLTVLENVRLAIQSLSGGSFRFWQRIPADGDDTRRAFEILDLVGLREVARLSANVLPHGGKRKLELAILLAADPELLLLDEPTAGMASEQVPELMTIIADIARRGDKTIVMVEHNMNVVMGISDRITVMNAGKVLTEGTPAQIAADKTVQKVYLGELYNLAGGAA
jgi:branched-chain amino acid transport system ATP-binding protein